MQGESWLHVCVEPVLGLFAAFLGSPGEHGAGVPCCSIPCEGGVGETEGEGRAGQRFAGLRRGVTGYPVMWAFPNSTALQRPKSPTCSEVTG
jgi:hypothetical protein